MAFCDVMLQTKVSQPLYISFQACAKLMTSAQYLAIRWHVFGCGTLEAAVKLLRMKPRGLAYTLLTLLLWR